MRLFKPLMIIATLTNSCEKLTHVYSIRQSKPIPASSMHITKITPLAAKPGETVTVEGSDIGYQSTFMVGETVVKLQGTSGTTATFTMPETTRSGAFKISVGRPDNLIGIVDAPAKFMISDSSDDSLPILMASASDICSPLAFRDAQGDIQLGTRNCSVVPDCTAGGQIGCKTVANYISAESSLLTPGIIKAGVTIAGVPGAAILTPANCSAAGQQECVATGSYYSGVICGDDDSACYLPAYQQMTQPLKSISYDSISNGKASIRSSLTLSGIAGTLADCSTNGISGCVTTSTFKSGDLSNLSSANIKNGVKIAGTTGEYPSSNYPLASNTETQDLNDTFDIKMKSSAIFEYFDSSGTKYTNSGSAKIVAENIASDVVIFGTTGTLTSPAAWDLRQGSKVVTPAGTVTGKLKVNCRNAANLPTFDQASTPVPVTVSIDNDTLTTTNAHGFSTGDTVRLYASTAGGSQTPSPLVSTGPNSTYYVVSPTNYNFKLASSSGGSAIDITTTGLSVYVYRWGNGTAEIWDTIADYIDNSSPVPSSIPSYTAWTSDNLCGGLEDTTDDANVWKNVTTVGDSNTTLIPCSATTATRCSYKDKISGLEWRKPDTTGRDWASSVTFCGDLTYNGKTDWRLPTQKELFSAFVDGIASTAGTPYWVAMGDLTQNYWTSTTFSSTSGDAIYLIPTSGAESHTAKTNTYRVLCVRP